MTSNQMGLISVSYNLKRIERLDNKIPLRKDRMGNFEVFSKYVAGESSGGEFFDIINKDNESLLVLTSTNNYAVSASTIECLDYFYNIPSIGEREVDLFLFNLKNDLGKELGKNFSLEILLLLMDKGDGGVSGYNWGKSRIVGRGREEKIQNESSAHTGAPTRFFLKGDSLGGLLLVSPGASKNLTDFSREINIEDIFVSSTDVRALMNKVFFQINKDVDRYFLKHDAFFIYIR